MESLFKPVPKYLESKFTYLGLSKYKWFLVLDRLQYLDSAYLKTSSLKAGSFFICVLFVPFHFLPPVNNFIEMHSTVLQDSGVAFLLKAVCVCVWGGWWYTSTFIRRYRRQLKSKTMSLIFLVSKLKRRADRLKK